MEKKDFIVWASKLQHNYEPAPEIKTSLAEVELIAIVGPTGAGKSTLIDRLGIPKVLSTVTRDKRPGEKDKHSYNFTNDYLQVIDDIKQGKYVQYLVSNSGEFYGTHRQAYPEFGPCTMAIVAGAIENFKSLGFKRITQIYIMPPSYVEWMRRIGGVRTQDLLTRISEARDSIVKALEDENYIFVLNDNIDLALIDIQNILDGKPVNQHRTQLAIGTADILLEHIGEEVN